MHIFNEQTDEEFVCVDASLICFVVFYSLFELYCNYCSSLAVFLYFQWSPDGKIILFGTANGELHIYDNLGNPIVSR